jgi:hypothetical protein
MNHQDSIRFFLFPHTVLAEVEARHLALLVPNLAILEMVNPLQLPSWAQDCFAPYPALPDQALSEQVRRLLANYRDFAEVHRDSDTLSLLRQEQYPADRDPSRILLQSELRGRPPQGPDKCSWLRLEAAAFLELARELDERELELESHYQRMEELEKGFREILGVIDGEEVEEIIETVNPPLVPDYSRFVYLLERRLLSWYRLFADHILESDGVLVALKRDITTELLDPIETEWDNIGRELSLVQQPVAVIPSLRSLSPADFTALRRQLLESGVLESYWRALTAAIQLPDQKPLWDDARHQADMVRGRIFDFCLEQNLHPKEQVVLVMNRIPGLSHHDLWKRLDKSGYEHLAADVPASPAGVTLFHMESLLPRGTG